jgi:hypothetical protein
MDSRPCGCERDARQAPAGIPADAFPRDAMLAISLRIPLPIPPVGGRSSGQRMTIQWKILGEVPSRWKGYAGVSGCKSILSVFGS